MDSAISLDFKEFRRELRRRITILRNSLVNTPSLFPSQELVANVSLILQDAHRSVGQPKSLRDARSAMFDLYVVLLWRKSRLSLALKKLQLKKEAEQMPKRNTMLETHAMRDEVLRLLALCRELFGNLAKTPNLIRAHDEETERLLDKDELDRQDKILINEVVKVSELEAVVAAIGTMSAGKSTCINAIVGADILPHRATPMTTYPTKVCHDPARVEPILEFPLVEEFEAFVSAVKEKISEQLSQNDDNWDKVVKNNDDRKTAKELMQGEFDIIPSHSEGVESIRRLMMAINDLSRLGGLKNVDIATPLPLRNDEPALPTLRVRFHHIGDDKFEGRLAILDTPGPNEAGQEGRLWNVLDTEVKQASAIIVVADCTQLRTEASDQVERLVNRLDNSLRDRIFVFANKFDQLIMDNWDEEDVRSDFAQRLESAGLAPERIFPTKGRNAFLSNWADRKVEVGRLPKQGEPEWTLSTGFGEFALGATWKTDIEDARRVQACARQAWEDSLFDEPLEKVVRMAAKNAAQIALQSGIYQARGSASLIDQFLKTRHNAARLDADRLVSEIEVLNNNIDQAKRARSEVKQSVKAPIDEFMKGIENAATGAGDAVEAMISTYFTTGEPPSREKIRTTVGTQTRKKIGKILNLTKSIGFGSLLSADSTVGGRAGGKPSEGSLKNHFVPRCNPSFEGPGRKKEAQNLVNKIQKSLSSIFEEADASTDSVFQAAITEVGRKVDDIVDLHLGPILKDARERLDDVFDVQVKLPAPNIAAAATVSGTGAMGNAIKSGERKYKERIVKRSFLGSIKRFFGDAFETDWGYEWKDRTAPRVDVRLDHLKKLAFQKIKKFNEYYREEAMKYRENELPSSLDSYFNEIESILQRFSGSLSDALEDRKLIDEELRSLIDALNLHLKEVEVILLDLNQIESGLEVA